MGAFKDKQQLLKKMSFKKSWNAFKLYSSYRFSKWGWSKKHRGMPISLSLEPTTACNLGCPECPSGLKQFTRPTGNLRKELYQQLIDELHPYLLYLNFYFQGEPFIHPQLVDWISYASQHKIYTSTSTNAHFINENLAEKIVQSGLNRMIISIDGTSQETYESYRINGQLDKVLAGTKKMVEAKKKHGKGPHLIFQFLVVKANEHQIPDLFQLAKAYEVDEVRLKTAQFYDYKNGNPLMPENEKYSRYVKQKDGTYRIKNKMENHCKRMWTSAVVTWDGRVVPCCFDKDTQHQMGIMKERAFEDIWRSDKYNLFRKQVLSNRKGIDICTNCSEGSKVWA